MNKEDAALELQIVMLLVPFVDKAGRKRIGAILKKLAEGMLR